MRAGLSGCWGELNFELWIGDAAVIRTKRVRKQKTDRQDAQLILKLMLKDDFPQNWVPSAENRDMRQCIPYAIWDIGTPILFWTRVSFLSGKGTLPFAADA